MSTLTTPSQTMIPVARPYIGVEEEKAVLEALRSGWITQGPRVGEFERQFAAYIGCEHAVAVSSCTTALQLALLVLGIGVGDEVICPSLSFIATANAIVHTGATPVFGDIDLASYNLDANEIGNLVSPRTKAILVVHQVGLPADMDAIMAVAAKYKLPVVEDAACAVGATYKGGLIGNLGNLTCFSFHPRKILTTGEGGMITTINPAFAERLRRLRQHAMSLSDVTRHQATSISTETYDEVGFNFRMTDMQAAVGTIQLARLDSFLDRRRYLAGRYTAGLRRLPWLIPPATPPEANPNYQSYMVRLLQPVAAKRDQLMQYLLDRSISTRRSIMAIHRERPFRSSCNDASLPRTNLATETGLILPLFHQMTEADQDYVIETIEHFTI